VNQNIKNRLAGFVLQVKSYRFLGPSSSSDFSDREKNDAVKSEHFFGLPSMISRARDVSQNGVEEFKVHIFAFTLKNFERKSSPQSEVTALQSWNSFGKFLNFHMNKRINIRRERVN